MKHKRFYFVWVLVFAVTLTFLFYSRFVVQNVQAQKPALIAERTAQHEIQAAWGAARENGYYSYTSKIIQTTWPALRLENTGLSPKTEHIYVEGETNLADEFMYLKLWADDGSAALGQAQHEIKIEDGQSWVRSGGDWLPQEQNVSDLFAPGSDPLAYLIAADNASENGEEIRVLPFLADGKLVYTRYGFDLDGPVFAAYMRENLEEALRQSGELPPGIGLDTAEIYRQMTGTGELLVDVNGLPKRLSLNIAFPPQELERVEVAITTDFNFPMMIAGDSVDDAPLLGLAATLRGGLASLKWGDLLGTLFAVVAVFSFVVVLILYSQSKKLYATLAITLIVSMLVTPLLQSQQVMAFSQKQKDAQAQRTAEQQDHQAKVEAEAALAGEQFDPRVNPLRSSNQSTVNREQLPVNTDLLLGNQAMAAAVDDTDTDGDRLWDVDEITLSLYPNNPDTDGDGLSDGVEMLELGTSPYAADTDEDGLSDWVEVSGFYFDGTKYYTNPNDADTNGDGRLDTLEATIITETLHAYDTDADGTPDLFDFDDDGDDVPDRVDLAPTDVITGLHASENPYIDQTEFTFQLDGLTPGKPAFVDFQIRPYDPAHIGYAFNVLDWPAFDGGPWDVDGQITRINETTFGATGKDANGDMRLVPYLEITIPYDAARQRYGLLPLKPGVSKATKTETVSDWLDTDETDELGIAVRCATTACNNVIAEVPLTVVYDRDEDGQPMNPVAFGGRMFYRTDLAGYSTTQKMRLVWHIIGLVDVCEEDCWESTRRVKRENWHETTTLFQTYYDDFSITGLNVVEDHGLQAGVLFENPQSVISAPDYDPDTHYGVNTWNLSLGLGGFFISRFQDACGRNMNDLDDISAALLNTNQTVQDCWELDGDFEMLRYEYAHQGGVAQLALEDVNDILETHFLDGSGEPYIPNPTLVYLLRETNRIASLGSDEDVKPLPGGAYQISMSGKPNVTVTMNWATYEHNGNSGWRAVDLQTYLQEMEENLRVVLSAEEAFSGYVEETIVFAVSYYIRMYIGVSEFSVIQGTLIEEPEKLKLKFKATKFGKNVTGVMKFYHGLQADAKELEEFLKDPSLEAEIRRSKAFDASWDKAKLTFDTILTAISIVQGAIEIYKLTIPFIRYLVCKGYEHLCPQGFLRTLEVTDYVIKAVSLALKAVSQVIKLITKVVDILFKIAKQGLDALIQISKTAGKTIAFGILGLVISTGLSIGLLLATIFISGDYDAWVKGASSIGASVAIGIVLLVLTLIPYINIIIIIIGIIDLLISTACFVIDTVASELSKDNASYNTLNDVNTALQNTICPGIMGWATALITPYSNQSMVDLNQEDRLDISNFGMTITNPDGTIREGDYVAVYADVTVGVYNTVPTGAAALYSLRYEPWDAFGNTTFWYKLQDDKSEWDATYGAMMDQWQALGPFGGMYYPIVTGRRLEQTSHLYYFSEFGGAGINKPLVPKFYLSESWAVPLFHCVLTVCWDEAQLDMAFYPFDLPRYDIFPTTLDGFYELKLISHSSYRLAWDYKFPTLQDADGDGLRARYIGGNDPDDKYIDSDNDWLADFYEIQFGSNPKLADSDGDNLSDYLEALYGTHPQRPDTDSDGLTDWEELQGWEFVYAFDTNGDPLVTRAQSDPLHRDTDGDSLSDKMEKKYGLNPRVYSESNIIGITPEMSDTDGYVLPGATVQYTSTIENNLKGRYALGRYEADPASPLQGGYINEGYILPPLGAMTRFDSVTIPTSWAQSGPLTITHWTGAQITDLRGDLNGRIMVLHLDEVVKVGARNAVYLDALLNGNNGQCWPNCPTSQNGGISGRAANFSSGDQIRVQMAVPQDQYTLSFLFRTDEKDMGIFSVDPAGESDLTVHIDPDGDICAKLKTDTICSQNENYADNDWHHVVHTYLSDGSGTQHWLFVDGVLKQQSNTTVLTGAAPAFVDIGYARHDVAADAYFEGLLDEVEIFDNVLSAAEVQEMTTAFAGGDDGPMVDLRFEDNYPYLISPDYSLHGNFAQCDDAGTCPSSHVGIGGFGADSARDFDGSDDFMVLPDVVGEEFTIAFWFKSNQVAGDSDNWWEGVPLVSSVEGVGEWYGVSLGDGHVMFGVGGTTITHTANLADNTWHHVAATRDSSGNLNLIIQDPNPGQKVGPTKNYSSDIHLGENEGSIAYDGLLDNLKIYDRVLSRSEIDDLALGVRRIEMRFDEPPERTIFLDSTGNDYTGECDYANGGCPETGFAGPFRGAAYFDGQNDFISLQHSEADSTFLGDYTLSLWVRPEAPGGTILSKGSVSQTIRLSIDAAGKVHLDREADTFANSAYLTSTGTVNWDAWNHIAVVYDRQNMTLYLNGSSLGGGAMPSQSAHRDDTAPVLIGAEYVANGNPTNFFRGYLDEVWVYERSLQPEQVQRLREKGPAIWMPLDEGPGSDSFANIADGANPGTCSLAPVSGDPCGCPNVGGVGRLRQGVKFEDQYFFGSRECLAIPQDNIGSTGLSFTFGAWFMPGEQRFIHQVLMSKKDTVSVLIPGAYSSNVRVKVPYSQNGYYELDSLGELLLNQWNHVMVTLGEEDDGTWIISIYLNGALDNTIKATNLPSDIQNSNPVILGADYIGQADEVAVYNSQLRVEEIKALYDYQSARYDTKVEQRIIVDADNPIVWLDHPIDYIRPISTVLSAGATDPTMAVINVEYRLDGGSWQPATRDGESWLFYFIPSGQNQQTIELRATDSLGNIGTDSRTLTLDNTPPDITLDTANLIYDAYDFCMLNLDGIVTDAGSGVEAVYVEVIEQGGLSLVPGNMHTAWVNGNQWGHFLEPMKCPYGDTFTVYLTAIDRLGNRIETIGDSAQTAGNHINQASHTLQVDIAPPVADLTDMGIHTDMLTGVGAARPVISGTVTDIPYPMGALLQLHFEEPVGAERFHDGAGGFAIGACSGGSCPTAGEPGKYGSGVTFDGGDFIDLGRQQVIDGAADNFAAMAWIYLTDTTGVKTILGADTTNSPDGFSFSVVDAGLRVETYGVHAYESTQITLPTNEWVHVAAVMDHAADGSAYAVLFYVNGLPVDNAIHDAPPVLNEDDPIRIGSGFVGTMDEVVLLNIAPTPAMVKDIAQPVSLGVDTLEVGLLHIKDWGDMDKVSWEPAALAAPGEIFSTWQYTIPANLEGEYQLYLRSTDKLPRANLLPTVWQGLIDTQAPRAELRYTPPRFPGDGHLLQCWVEDFNLTEQGYDCPIPGSMPAYYDEGWYTSVIPTARLYGLISPVTPLPTFTTTETLTVFDQYGAKTTVSATISTENWPLGVSILTPTIQTAVAPLQSVDIAGATYAQASLKTLTLTANGVPVYTENWGGGAVTDTVWSTVFTPTAEGRYLLLAEIEDWAGSVITSSAPVVGMSPPETIVYADAADPTIAITTTSITAENFDIHGFVRVSGLVTETNQVQSLQAKLDTLTYSGVWETILLSDTTGLVGEPWSARLFASTWQPPAGSTYTLTARVTDVAGKTAETSRTIFADAQPPEIFQRALSYDDGTGTLHPLGAWDTITSPLNPTLVVTWT
ncbi:MAG: LamG domain-containing protein, partial [Chloroflexi bacterium]|nr:LamG domain-containing protein [Chloroflexota bacterium]